MGGSHNAASLVQAQGPAATSRYIVKDIAKAADRPGFITWKSKGDPWFDLDGSAKITGKDANLDVALQKTLVTGTQKQGATVSQFPNVKPLIVQASPATKAAIEKSNELSGLGEMSWSSPEHLCYMAVVLGVGIAAGYWLAKKAQ
jgi:hypothetical protein